MGTAGVDAADQQADAVRPPPVLLRVGLRAVADAQRDVAREDHSPGDFDFPILTIEPPATHRRLRRLIAPGFRQAVAAGYEETFLRTARAEVAALGSFTSANLLDTLIEPFVVRCFGLLLGIPADRLDHAADLLRANLVRDPSRPFRPHDPNLRLATMELRIAAIAFRYSSAVMRSPDGNDSGT